VTGASALTDGNRKVDACNCVDHIGSGRNFGGLWGGCHRVVSPNIAVAWSSFVRSRWAGNSSSCTATVPPITNCCTSLIENGALGYKLVPGEWLTRHSSEIRLHAIISTHVGIAYFTATAMVLLTSGEVM